MKDSGVEWIGEIPAEWKTIQLRYCFNVCSGATPKSNNPEFWDGDINWITPSDFETDDMYISNSTKRITQAGLSSCGLLITPANNLIFSKRAPIGKVAINKIPACTNQGCFSCIARDNVDVRFYYYVMSVATEEFEQNGKGSTFREISAEAFKAIKLPFPDSLDQHRIADYLDRKCAQIDSIISHQQAIIEKLKEYKLSLITEAVTKGLNPDAPMKDSGVEWIGEVPEHWRVSKIKYVSSFSPACQTASLTDESIVGYAPMECIKQGFQMQYEKALSEIPRSLTPYYDGDIVMAKVTPCFENGNIAIMSDTASGIGFGSSELFVFRACNIQREHLFFWLRNLKLKSIAISTMTGTGGLKRVSPYFIKNSPIPVPPENEQMEICVYLTGKCAAIDSTVSKKKKLIDSLSSYKKSLIYEAVTGKREI